MPTKNERPNILDWNIAFFKLGFVHGLMHSTHQFQMIERLRIECCLSGCTAKTPSTVRAAQTIRVSGSRQTLASLEMLRPHWHCLTKGSFMNIVTRDKGSAGKSEKI